MATEPTRASPEPLQYSPSGLERSKTQTIGPAATTFGQVRSNRTSPTQHNVTDLSSQVQAVAGIDRISVEEALKIAKDKYKNELAAENDDETFIHASPTFDDGTASELLIRSNQNIAPSGENELRGSGIDPNAKDIHDFDPRTDNPQHMDYSVKNSKRHVYIGIVTVAVIVTFIALAVLGVFKKEKAVEETPKPPPNLV